MSRQSNIELTTKYFSAMSEGEWATVEAMYHDDIILHMLGTTPASGRLEGKAKVGTLDIDKSPAIPRQMGVQSVPTFVVFHSAVIAYLPEERRTAFHELMTGLVAAGR